MIDRLFRPHLRAFQPYTSARTEVSEARVLLDANELSLGSPVAFGGLPLNRYPDPLQTDLRAALADLRGVAPEMVFAGVGSDEIIDLLIRLFCTPGSDAVAILEPTYGVYRVAANLSAVEAIGIGLDAEFQPDVDRTLGAALPAAKMLFLCSPNNPTGNLLRRDDILALCARFSGIVVVDEAYVEFAGPAATLAPDVERLDNLVVLRTLSKAWGLAGIRLGYCVAHPLIIASLLRIKAPYSINAVTSHLALMALGDASFLSTVVPAVIAGRARLAAELRGLPGVRTVYPSDANFILAEFDDARAVYERLLRRGISVRQRSEERLRSCLRLTVGSAAEIDLLLGTLKEGA
jgi:histidinol-phosphate aminotransferase